MMSAELLCDYLQSVRWTDGFFENAGQDVGKCAAKVRRGGLRVGKVGANSRQAFPRVGNRWRKLAASFPKGLEMLAHVRGKLS